MGCKIEVVEEPGTTVTVAARAICNVQTCSYIGPWHYLPALVGGAASRWAGMWSPARPALTDSQEHDVAVHHI